MKISINIPFWFSKEDRLDNLVITYTLLNRLKDYLISKGLDVSVNVFEFSEKQYFANSIFSPIGEEFSKSLKINTAIKYLKENDKPDIVSFIDSDCFVDKDDFENVYKQLLEFDKNYYYCNNFIKLAKGTRITEELELDKSFYKYRNLGGLLQALGGMWFMDFDTLYEVGGFDERYIDWGGEDEDIGKRLILKGILPKQLKFKAYHLYHELSPSKINVDENSEQQHILRKDNSIIRATLLNNYTI